MAILTVLLIYSTSEKEAIMELVDCAEAAFSQVGASLG